jgi:hypothetical protein
MFDIQKQLLYSIVYTEFGKLIFIKWHLYPCYMLARGILWLRACQGGFSTSLCFWTLEIDGIRINPLALNPEASSTWLIFRFWNTCNTTWIYLCLSTAPPVCELYEWFMFLSSEHTMILSPFHTCRVPKTERLDFGVGLCCIHVTL